jgi:acyl-CoA synthetase (AMP-forming)/AMP-acid ligase II
MTTLASMADVLLGDEDGPALQVGSGGAAYTRGQLRRLATQFAATLRASGIKPGDVVTIAEPNTVGFPAGCSWQRSFPGATHRDARAPPSACLPCSRHHQTCRERALSTAGPLQTANLSPFINALAHTPPNAQVEYVVAFIGTTLARAIAAPLNQNYKTVRGGAVRGSCSPLDPAQCERAAVAALPLATA